MHIDLDLYMYQLQEIKDLRLDQEVIHFAQMIQISHPHAIIKKAYTSDKIDELLPEHNGFVLN